MKRFMGLWHEQARLPQVFQIGRCSNVKFEIDSTQENTFNIEHFSSDPLLPSEKLTGKATLQTYDRTNTKFYTYYNTFAQGQYWVLDVDSEYEVAVLGDPCRYGLWVMSRKKHIDIEIVKDKLQWAKETLGYHVDTAI